MINIFEKVFPKNLYHSYVIEGDNRIEAIAFSVDGGTIDMVLTDEARLGIGTTNTDYQLTINGTGINISNSSETSDLCFNGVCIDDWGDVNSSSSGTVIGTGNAGYIALWNDTSEINDSVIFQDSDGEIGIGTITPGALLNIYGTGILLNISNSTDT